MQNAECTTCTHGVVFVLEYVQWVTTVDTETEAMIATQPLHHTAQAESVIIVLPPLPPRDPCRPAKHVQSD
jgi:hypothetical protein